MSTSKLQEQTKTRLYELVGDLEIVENYRPDWLQNPETGFNLELDFWLPEAQVGIEVQGRQHFEYIPHFHQSGEDFSQQIERDRLKQELCQKNSIYLYEVTSQSDIDGLVDFIRSHHQETAQALNNREFAIKALSYYAARLYICTKHKPKGKPYWKVKRRAEISRLAKRMAMVAERHDIKLTLIEPDFSISKTEMAFPGKPIIEIQKLYKGVVQATYKAAILSVDNNIACLRRLASDKANIDMIFDLTSGYRIPRLMTQHTEWKLRLKTLPGFLTRLLNDE